MRPIPMILLGVALGLLTACASPAASRMTLARLEALITELAVDVEGAPGGRSFTFDGVRMACISDVPNDRMRLVAPIGAVGELSAEQIARILEANFHTALDARYATSQGVLYAAFVHPLSPLNESQVRSALQQTANLARTFGTAYSSGILVYGGGTGEPSD